VLHEFKANIQRWVQEPKASIESDDESRSSVSCSSSTGTRSYASSKIDNLVKIGFGKCSLSCTAGKGVAVPTLITVCKADGCLSTTRCLSSYGSLNKAYNMRILNNAYSALIKTAQSVLSKRSLQGPRIQYFCDVSVGAKISSQIREIYVRDQVTMPNGLDSKLTERVKRLSIHTHIKNNQYCVRARANLRVYMQVHNFFCFLIVSKRKLDG